MREKNILFGIIFVTLIASSYGSISLDGVSFDPAIISAGDEVDIILNFQDMSALFSSNSDFSNDGEYKLHVWIEPSDTVTKNYVTFLDAEGDRNIGHLFTGDVWRKNFRIKVADNAPVGTYELKAVFQYEVDGKLSDEIQEKYFTMNVKKEGIVLDLTNINTVPAQIKPGDNFVQLNLYLENSGLKDAKNVEVSLNLPENMDHSYSTNQVYAGLVAMSSSSQITFNIDLNEDLEPGMHELVFNIDYKDLDNNEYNKMITLPLFVQSKPLIEVVESSGSGLAGSSGELVLKIKNIGDETAESVDVRIIKQNSQPFDFDVRSNYIGELEPDEEGLAFFEIDIKSDAEEKVHDFKVLIRAKGDSDEGDDTIYTYSRRAKFEVDGVAPNNVLRLGIAIGVIAAIFIIYSMFIKKK
ncbi:hypothetical protein C0585_08160 [Candidatus Woesearchaeota archaeon]|nr:MAG: hypothetical protein C0585_08160 [Candidatus Woesearchaeota archaeon]